MLIPLFRLLARLPLPWLHRAGAALGWLVYKLSPTYASRLRENLYASGVCAGAACAALLRRAVAETGKGVTELIAVWFGSDDKVSRLVRCETWNVVEEARRGGKGLIFLTPHLGCFEISALYGAQRLPITVLYRPPKLRWLEPLMVAGPQPLAIDGRTRDPERRAHAVQGLAARRSGRPVAGPGAGRRRRRMGGVFRPPGVHHDAGDATAENHGRGGDHGVCRTPAARCRLSPAFAGGAGGPI